MISVLIPVFNNDISILISDLQYQKLRDNIPCEIVVFDDASVESIRKVNRKVCIDTGVVYKELVENCGRVEIRKRLSNAAQFEWMLFIDSDSKIIKQTFLQQYLDSIDFNDAIVGGTSYEIERPPCSKRLHWKYGKHREITNDKKKTFRTNNFCIRKSLFKEIDFPNEIKGYGHEDTYIGIQLEKLGVHVKYIENPVLHLGVEYNKIFITKSENALKNLLELQKYVDEKTLRKHVTLYDIYCKLRSLPQLVFFVHAVIKPFMERNLYSCNPRLFYFDFYRLYKLILLSRKV